MPIHKELYKSTLKHFDFDISTDQDELLTQLCNFYVQPNNQSLFILKGYAGTGKTSLLSAFVKALVELKRKSVLLAPTGRAAKVFAQRSNKMALPYTKRYTEKKRLLEVQFN